LEVLGSVSQRWQRSRDELRDTQASGGPTWLLHRQSESGQLASLLGAQVRSSVLLVGDESSGRQALLQSWFEAAADSGRAADVYATSAAQLLAGMSGLGQWQARLTRVMEAAELLDAVLYFDDLADLFGDHANSQIDIPRAMLRYRQDGRVRVVGRITPELLNALQPRNASFFGAFHSLRVAALSAAQTADIISASARASATQRVRLAPRSAAQLVALVDRYDPYRSLPGKAVRFYDELLAAFERESTQEQVLEARDVQTWLSRQTGSPERLLREDQAQRPSDVEEKLGSELVGQTAAVRAVSEAIAVIKAG